MIPCTSLLCVCVCVRVRERAVCTTKHKLWPGSRYNGVSGGLYRLAARCHHGIPRMHHQQGTGRFVFSVSVRARGLVI